MGLACGPQEQRPQEPWLAATLALRIWIRPWTQACSLKPWWGACQGSDRREVAASIHLQTQWTKLYGGHGWGSRQGATLKPQTPPRAPLQEGLRPGSSTCMCRMHPR